MTYEGMQKVVQEFCDDEEKHDSSKKVKFNKAMISSVLKENVIKC